ncbi:ArsR/SmtB family transcription factor [Streptomyces sp. NPDC048603]|uniref:ArsR/SmtB family transcription factor n=1 Tax=Streptomyces sp. NPDC048603 TaxID=3365577 RepID=UPI003714A02D
MLRVVFTLEDLARTRVTVLGPLAETQLSLRALRRRDEGALFDAWRRRVGPRVPADARELAPFLADPRLWIIDLFTLVGPVESVEEGVDRLRGTPRRLLGAELTPSPGLDRVRPRWLDASAADGASVGRLARALADHHRVALAPYWTRAEQYLGDQAGLLGRLIATDGISAALRSLAPALRWEPPAPEVPGYVSWRGLPYEEFRLGGRGLVLAPSLFCGPVPQLFAPPDDGPALLVFSPPRSPAEIRAVWSPPRSAGGTHKALAALLGGTRATVLAVLGHGQGSTTTELARRLGISPSSASQHTGVLREAGLVSSTRHRNTVRHTLTRQGLALLEGS